MRIKVVSKTFISWHVCLFIRFTWKIYIFGRVTLITIAGSAFFTQTHSYFSFTLLPIHWENGLILCQWHSKTTSNSFAQTFHVRYTVMEFLKSKTLHSSKRNIHGTVWNDVYRTDLDKLDTSGECARLSACFLLLLLSCYIRLSYVFFSSTTTKEENNQSNELKIWRLLECLFSLNVKIEPIVRLSWIL